jgi:hypothetical protein
MRAWHFGFGLLAACSTVDEPPAEALLLTDPQGDVWSTSPPPSRLTIDVIRESDPRSRANVTDGPMPDSTSPRVRLGDPGTIDFATLGHFEATGFDATGATVFRGQTISLYLNGIAALELPLFLGRVGVWSRPPNPLASPHVHASVGFVGAGFLVTAGGDSAGGSDPKLSEFYDLVAWKGLSKQPVLPRVPKSMAVVGTAALLIDDTGATWFDLYSQETLDAPPPEGFSFADVAGGNVVPLGDSQYIVGATRPTGPTKQILRIKNGDRSLTAISLATARAGAAAGAIRGQLYIAAGNTGAAGGAPLEVCQAKCETLMGPGADGQAPGPRYPPDASVGAALVEGPVSTAPDAGLTPAVAFLAGGVDATTGQPSGLRTFELDCAAASCPISPRAALPALSRTRALVAGGFAPRIVIVGEAADGEDHAFVVDPASGMLAATETAFRERRQGGTAATFPNGQIGVIGGTSVGNGAPVLSVEMFTGP